MLAQLMARLGYTRYGAQGGDWGAIILRQLGLVDPTHQIGLHSNMCIAGPPPGAKPNEGVSPEELKQSEAARARTANETGYSQLQGTKPQTLGYSLNDSPAGLAAWIVEKFRTWSDSGGNVEKHFSKDELLTNITIYWVTETGPVVGPALLREPERSGTAGACRSAVRLCAVSEGDVRARRRNDGSKRRTTFSSTPKCPAADTSPRSKNPNCSSKTSGSSSAAGARHRRIRVSSSSV